MSFLHYILALALLVSWQVQGTLLPDCVQNNTNYPGSANIYQSPNNMTIDQCMDLCNTNTTCDIAEVYSDGRCYMKQGMSSPSNVTGSTAAYKSCFPGCTEFLANYGSAPNIDNTHFITPTLLACQSLCQSTPACVGAQYYALGKWCWLKSNLAASWRFSDSAQILMAKYCMDYDVEWQDGWLYFGGSQYYFGFNSTLASAQQFCTSNYSRLVDINSAQEQSFLQSILHQMELEGAINNGSYFILGLPYPSSPLWDSWALVDFTLWCQGKPTNNLTGTTVMATATGYCWEDRPTFTATTLTGYICERAALCFILGPEAHISSNWTSNLAFSLLGYTSASVAVR